MKVTVKLIGPLIYEAGFSEKEIEVAEGVTVEKLLEQIARSAGPPPDRHPERQGRRSRPRPSPRATGSSISPIYSGG